jgi:hypothetical protein
MSVTRVDVLLPTKLIIPHIDIYRQKLLHGAVNSPTPNSNGAAKPSPNFNVTDSEVAVALGGRAGSGAEGGGISSSSRAGLVFEVVIRQIVRRLEIQEMVSHEKDREK